MEKDKKQKIAYKGCIHIHTINSDGTGTIEEISLAAKKAGLSWIIITDHNYFDFDEGIYNDVYVLKKHYLSIMLINLIILLIYQIYYALFLYSSYNTTSTILPR